MREREKHGGGRGSVLQYGTVPEHGSVMMVEEERGDEMGNGEDFTSKAASWGLADVHPAACGGLSKR